MTRGQGTSRPAEDGVSVKLWCSAAQLTAACSNVGLPGSEAETDRQNPQVTQTPLANVLRALARLVAHYF